MVGRTAAGAALLGALGCRQSHAPAAETDAPGPTPAALVAPPAPVDPSLAPRRAVRWRWGPRPPVDLRGADRDGTVWAVSGDTLLDETHEHATPLPQEVPCPLSGSYAMEFGPAGVGYLLVNGRLYLRAGAHLGWVVTPLCTDVTGAPWSYRRGGGWALAAHSNPAAGPSMLLTQEPVGGHGWYAITALDRTIRAAIVDEDRSMLSLVNHGHLVLINQVDVAAGEVLAGRGARFEGLSRTAAGMLAWRDEGPRRVLLAAANLREPWTEVSGSAAGGVPTQVVFRVDLARLLAVTAQGLELSDDGGATWTEVYVGALSRPTFGLLPGGVPAVLCRDGVLTP